jgi:hypothetical protein
VIDAHPQPILGGVLTLHSALFYSKRMAVYLIFKHYNMRKELRTLLSRSVWTCASQHFKAVTLSLLRFRFKFTESILIIVRNLPICLEVIEPGWIYT